MTIGEYLPMATKQLQDAGIESARLDVLIVLEDVLSMDRSRLFAHPEIELNQAQIDQLNTFITQRKLHTPLAYIRGRVAFYGREFAVNTHVLVPRPETESMVDLLKEISFKRPPLLADVGTGSG